MKKILLMLLFTAAANAQVHDGALTVTPAVITLRGAFGQSTTQRLHITNGTSRELTFDVFAQDVVVRNGKRVFVAAGDVDGSIAATAIFSRNRITLRSGETSSVDATFTTPLKTSCRAVVALFRTTQPIITRNMQMTPAVGTLLTFRLSDALDLQSSDVAIRPQTQATNAHFAQTAINSGSEPAIARGVVAILDTHGALVGKSALPPHRLLPAERAELTSEFGGELAPGKYRVVVTLDLEGKIVTHDAEMVIR